MLQLCSIRKASIVKKSLQSHQQTVRYYVRHMNLYQNWDRPRVKSLSLARLFRQNIGESPNKNKLHYKKLLLKAKL